MPGFWILEYQLVCTLAWPDPIWCRDVIACNISTLFARGAYTASNNSPA